MKKIISFLVLVLVFVTPSRIYAQLDTEHWFAPMYDGQSNGSPYQYLYLSTSETTPFTVTIYNNNTAIGTRTISKGSPQYFSIPRAYIITSGTTDLFRVRTMGLHVKGDQKFFANLRFGVVNHAEITTSKGAAALGTTFYTVVAPNVNSTGITNLGFTAGIIATEDNTKVSIAKFNKTLSFTDGVNRNVINITLNRGQSYIIDGRSTTTNNRDGFIGTKITSDKPISVSNGNFNGQYASTNNNDGSDILMDQSVPVNQLGNTFGIIKGYGTVSSGMERAIIVAPEDNTEIYLNNSTTPVATINEGGYYIVPSSYYNNPGSDHYNLYIKTSKNVYVYQLLGGVASGDSPLATGGMNYIPPLNCYLPKKIDEIALINYMDPNGSSGNITTKLNIITEKGAEVKVNNVTPSAIYGPYSLSGTENWVTYSIPNVSGNITVTSTKAVTAGLAGGNGGAVGYGGYFAGFSVIPAIVKTNGDCLPGIKLEITEGFDSYTWEIKDSSGNYVPAPAPNNTYFYEPTQAGIYRVRIKQGSCDEITTQDFKFYNCTTYTNVDYSNTCTTETVTPQFALSSQSLNPVTVVIDTPPTKGTATVNPDGTITYTANPNAIGTDTFKFSFCGSGAIPDCETVQATIHLNQTAKYDVTLTECSTNGLSTYDLTSAEVTPNTNITKTYYKDAALTQQIPVGELSNYVSADGFVYVKLENSSGCPTTSAIITLKSKPSPVISPELYTQILCDEDIDGVIDGTYKVDVSTITPTVILNASAYNVRYYDTEQKANTGGTDNITGIFSFTGNTSIWIRVDSPDTCPFDVKEIPLKTGTEISLINSIIPTTVCDNDLDNSENISLSDYVNSFSTDSGITVKYFETLVNAQNNTNEVSVNQIITANNTFYYRFTKAGFCDAIGTLNIDFKQSTPPTTLLPSVTVCEGSTTTLNAGTGYTDIVWSTGETTQTIIVGVGTYWVDLTNDSGCVYRQEVTVLDSPKPQLNVANYTAIHCDEDIDGVIDGTYKVDVSTITPAVLLNASSYNVLYYDTEQKANTGGTDNITGIFSFTGNTSIWIRVDSTEFCPFEVKEIPLKTGTKISLTNSIIPTIVCDNDLDNSENINLSDYVNSFSTDSGITVKYFETLVNAQNNTNEVSVNQSITANNTFYYRFTKAGFCDAIGTLNIDFKQSTPSTTLLPSITVCEGSTTILNAGTGYTDIVWSTGETTQTITVGVGTYWVDLTNDSGCVYRQEVTVLDSPKPQLNVAAYNGTHCDDDFDGKIDITFSTDVTPKIIPNYDSSLYTVNYYSDAAMTQLLPDVWTYSANTTVYIKVTSVYCVTLTGQIDFKIGDKLTLLTTVANKTVCDDDYNGSDEINLIDYRTLFLSSSDLFEVSTTYYLTLTDAQKSENAISANQTLTTIGTHTYFYRFEKLGSCPNIGELKITYTKGFASTTLPASVTICENSTTELNAGTAHSSYQWYNENNPTVVVGTTAKITLPSGKYFVILTSSDGCEYKQNVEIIASPKPLWDIAAYNATHCDDDFDGAIKINLLDEVTPVILTNHNVFTVRYYATLAAANAGGNNNLLNNWSYSADTTIYVRADSQYCPTEIKPIEFKIGNRVSLSSSTAPVTVCDNDLDNSENISLSDYVNSFTTDTNVTVKYFETLQNAQNNTNEISVNQSITANKNFYFRFSKTGFCDNIGTLNISFKSATPSTTLPETVTVCEGTTTTLNAGTGYTSYLWNTGETTRTITVGKGEYWVEITNTSGCTYHQKVTVTESPKPLWNITAYDGTHCDDDFDGIIRINFLNEVTPVILTNHNVFTVRYYATLAAANAGGNNNLPNNWSYSADTTIYVRADSQYCPTEIKPIDFKFRNSITLITNNYTADPLCDDDFDGIRPVDLSDYVKNFTLDNDITVTYFRTLANANNNVNPITNPVTVNNAGTYYLRFHKNNFCDAVGQLNISIKTPKQSDIKDQQICPEKTTTLDAGAGFDNYLWSTGETTQSIDVGLGDYWVELTYNGCMYKYNVSVTATPLPKIVNVEIQGSTITINVTGGNKPYQYSLNGGPYQSSNVFTNVPSGDNTVSVISADNCAAVTTLVTVIPTRNVITPNGDGKNDVADYSDLLKKDEPMLHIFDRNGKSVFKGDQTNRFIWDGKAGGRTLDTGTYWYIMEWKEPGFDTVTRYNGWILLKNRE